MSEPLPFADPATLSDDERETGAVFAPRFDAAGLVTVVTLDASSGAPLMLAHMNAEALALTLETGIAHYWSRSRRKIWKKGETSGETQKLVELLVDCDQDALVMRVDPAGRGAACHTGRRSCFYRRVVVGAEGPMLEDTGEPALFEPGAVYGR